MAFSGFTRCSFRFRGRNSLMACTEAVEEVIDKHYSDQISELENSGKN